MDFKDLPRIICPARITPMAQGAIALLPATKRSAACDAHVESIADRDLEIEKWKMTDYDAQAFLIQYVFDSAAMSYQELFDGL